MTRAIRMLLLALLVPAPLAAQAPAAGGATPPPEGPQAAAPAAPATTTVVPLEPQGYDYDPDGRRDPFVSLLRRGVDGGRPSAGARPPGLAGLGVDEVSLKGTLESGSEFVAMLQGADGRTYVVHPGDRLFDGTVGSIARDRVVILQQVSDPLSVTAQREVVKTIRQRDEAR